MADPDSEDFLREIDELLQEGPLGEPSEGETKTEVPEIHNHKLDDEPPGKPKTG